jgi:hypothetical protein
MKKINNMLLAIALVAAFTLGVSSMANAGAFGDPDPTTGAMVMGWFDIGADSGDTDNVLPVIVNMSTENLSSPSSYRVHLIIWDVNSNHVWDKNLSLTPWDVWADASIRDIIENTIGDGMASAQRSAITETVTIDGVEVNRYRGYWTATVVHTAVGTSKPYQLNYPHAYLNILGGWVYVVDLLDGRTDGYTMVSVEAAELWAETIEMAFMLSFSADFWNRPWWWVDDTYVVGDAAISATGPYYSVLWQCSLDEAYETGEESAPFGKVYERFDATACLNVSLLTTGKAVTSDDTWLARDPSCDELPYDGGEAFSDLNRGGMMLFGRFFRNPSGGAISAFNNRLIVWIDTNSTGREVVLVVCDEEEGCHSFPLAVPDELNVIRLDEVVSDVLAGFIYFHSRQIESPGAAQRMLAYWRSITGTDSADYNCAGGNSITDFLPGSVSCTADGAENDVPFGNALQILGWTTNEGLGTAAESWGAIFPLIRKCIVGSPASLEVLQNGGIPPWLL